MTFSNILIFEPPSRNALGIADALKALAMPIDGPLESCVGVYRYLCTSRPDIMVIDARQPEPSLTRLVEFLITLNIPLVLIEATETDHLLITCHHILDEAAFSVLPENLIFRIATILRARLVEDHSLAVAAKAWIAPIMQSVSRLSSPTQTDPVSA